MALRRSLPLLPRIGLTAGGATAPTRVSAGTYVDRATSTCNGILRD